MAAPVLQKISSNFRPSLVNLRRYPNLNLLQKRFVSKDIKRFYKNVTITKVDRQYEINLDQKRLQTPMGNILRIPNEATALAVATEWDAQEKIIKRDTMHFTKLANTVLDNPTHRSTDQIITGILEYLDSDTVCYRVDEPPEFVDVQAKYWDTLIDAVQERYQIKIPTTAGLQATDIPAKTKEVFRQHLKSHNEWALTGYQFSVEAMKSFIIAIALIDGMVNVEDAVYLARLEQEFQAQKWGRVDWYHDIDMMDTQAKVAAASSLVHFSAELRETKSKGLS